MSTPHDTDEPAPGPGVLDRLGPPSQIHALEPEVPIG